MPPEWNIRTTQLHVELDHRRLPYCDLWQEGVETPDPGESGTGTPSSFS